MEDAEKLAKENAELKARIAELTKPAPVRVKSKSELKAETELKYARECRRETPNKTRDGRVIAAKGSGNCADHGTNGLEGFTHENAKPDNTPASKAARKVWGRGVADHKRNGAAVAQ